jgi:hypothetical protein
MERRSYGALAAVLFVLTGCGTVVGPEHVPTPTARPAPRPAGTPNGERGKSPEQLARDVAARLRSLRSFHIDGETVDHGGRVRISLDVVGPMSWGTYAVNGGQPYPVQVHDDLAFTFVGSACKPPGVPPRLLLGGMDYSGPSLAESVELATDGRATVATLHSPDGTDAIGIEDFGFEWRIAANGPPDLLQEHLVEKAPDLEVFDIVVSQFNSVSRTPPTPC